MNRLSFIARMCSSAGVSTSTSTSSTTKNGVAIVFGAGPGIGAATTRHLSQNNFAVAAVRRRKEELNATIAEVVAGGGVARAYGGDVRNRQSVENVFNQVTAELGPVNLVVFNVGAWYRESILTITPEKWSKINDMACLGGYHVGQVAANHMLQKSPAGGTIIFTGASASRRGSANFAAFSAAKSGLRMLAQSMSRELAPKNIHVAHVVIDSAVDTPAVRERFGDAVLQHEDGIVEPVSVSKAFLYLHQQSRDAWTFEMDLRPWKETW